MKRGFTLIELMVASCLLGMLVSVLAMVFNQSSVAWRTGVTDVAKLSEVRKTIGTFHEKADLDVNVCNARLEVSIWDDDGTTLRNRAIRTGANFGSAPEGYAEEGAGNAGGADASGSFAIGVRSAGPDGVFENEDDITTWPEDVN